MPATASRRRGHQVGADAGRDLIPLGVQMPRDGPRRGETRGFQVRALHQIKRQDHVHRAFNRGAADFAVALGGMGVADAEQSARDLNRQIKRRAGRQDRGCPDCRRRAGAARRNAGRVQP